MSPAAPTVIPEFHLRIPATGCNTREGPPASCRTQRGKTNPDVAMVIAVAAPRGYYSLWDGKHLMLEEAHCFGYICRRAVCSAWPCAIATPAWCSVAVHQSTARSRSAVQPRNRTPHFQWYRSGLSKCPTPLLPAWRRLKGGEN